MKNTGQKLIVISFVLALLATIAVFIYLESFKKPKEVINNTTLLVAVETIPARTLINKSMVTSIEVADNTFFDDYIKDSSKIIGKYTKETIIKNEGFRKDRLINEGEEELSLKIESNHRAVTINTTGDAGVAYLIKPGDSVDIVAYLSEKTDGIKIVRPDSTKVVLQNIEVLAIDQKLNREDKKTDEVIAKAPTTFLVTLSVKYQDLEKLVLAENIGNLKLALRPLKDTDTHETKGATWQELTVTPEESKASGTMKASNLNSTDTNNNTSNNTNNEKYVSYAVKHGDTLKGISKAFYGDGDHVEILKETNNIKDQDIIITGKIIKIPRLE